MPFIKSKNTTTNMMKNVIIALLPIIIFSVFKNGYIPYQKGYITFAQMFYPLLFVLIGMLSTLFFETLITSLALISPFQNKDILPLSKASFIVVFVFNLQASR